MLGKYLNLRCLTAAAAIMRLRYYGLILCIQLSLLANFPGQVDAKFYSQAIARDRLVRDLFTNYDAGSRPAPNGQKIDVITNLELQHFDFRESDGAFQFHGKLDVSWHDSKLIWSPKDYNNITRIYVPATTLWVPDLEIYNNAPDKFLRMQYNGMVMIEHTGRTLWAENVESIIFCTTNMHRWPHDEHECKIVLGSWTQHGYELDIIGADPKLTLSFDDFQVKNTQFRVVNYTAVHVATVYNCCEEPYISMNYQLVIVRRASFAVIFKMPAICVVLLTLAVFLMEPHRGEKLLLHGVSMVIIVFNLIFFAQNIGKFARNVPLLVVFYSVSFVLVTFGTLLSVFALAVSRSKLKASLPPGFAKVLKSRFGSMLDSYANHGAKPENAEMHSPFEDARLQEYSNLISSEPCPDEWTRFAVIIERICFLVYGIIFIILGTRCSV